MMPRNFNEKKTNYSAQHGVYKMLVSSGLGYILFQSNFTCLDDDNVPKSSTLYTPHRCAQ